MSPSQLMNQLRSRVGLLRLACVGGLTLTTWACGGSEGGGDVDGLMSTGPTADGATGGTGSEVTDVTDAQPQTSPADDETTDEEVVEPATTEVQPVQPESGSPKQATPTEGDAPGPVGIDIFGTCTPVCDDGSATDPDGDGWGWENEESCVVEDSEAAGDGGPCELDGPTSDAPTPAGEATGVEVDGECRPLCVNGDSADPDGDGWGWENEESCVVEGSPPAAGAPSCGDVTPIQAPTPTEPAQPVDVPGDAERPAGGAGSGFFVDRGRLYDANGNDFVIRGVNNAHVWFDTDGRYDAYDALTAIANYGFNTIRIVWETNRAQSSLLREIVARVVELEMIPMIELHDATGSMSTSDLHDMARYYARDDVRPILADYERHLLVNIANEWSGQDFSGAYQGAIDILRDAGINHTLVIDGNQWGQNSDSVLDNGEALLEYDPQHNLLFSNHMYETYGNQNGGAERITAVMEEAVARQIPYIVGEFGHQHGDPPQTIDFQHILDECARLQLGYIAWSWKGNNSDVAYLDMSVDWNGNQLTDWGDDIINGPNGIADTSMKASVFLL